MEIRSHLSRTPLPSYSNHSAFTTVQVVIARSAFSFNVEHITVFYQVHRVQSSTSFYFFFLFLSSCHLNDFEMKKSDSRSVRRFYLSLHFGFVFPAFLQKAMINTRPDVKESPKQVRESVGVYCFAAQPIARGTFTGLSYLYCACFFLLKITKWAQVIRREMWLLF